MPKQEVPKSGSFAKPSERINVGTKDNPIFVNRKDYEDSLRAVAITHPLAYPMRNQELPPLSEEEQAAFQQKFSGYLTENTPKPGPLYASDPHAGELPPGIAGLIDAYKKIKPEVAAIAKHAFSSRKTAAEKEAEANAAKEAETETAQSEATTSEAPTPQAGLEALGVPQGAPAEFDPAAYQKLAEHVGQVNSNINSANEASDKTIESMTAAYNKIVPIEPITPLRVIGDLVRIGGAFALNRNPGLALALASAGNAVKNYDPAYREYQQRKAFAGELLAGANATSLKEADIVASERAEAKRLEAQVGVASLEEKGKESRFVREEAGKTAASERAADVELQKIGVPSKGSLIDQVRGLTAESALVRKAFRSIEKDDNFEGYSREEMMHEALDRVINTKFRGQKPHTKAVQEAEKELLQKLDKEVKSQKKK